MTARHCTARDWWVLWLLLLPLPRTARSQVMDARLLAPGILRVAFTPQYQSWNQMYAADGSVIPLGAYLSADSAGSNFFPTLGRVENAVRDITGDPGYRLTLGNLTTRVDADVRRFPFALSLGLTRWLTFTATVPIVVTRVNAAIALDSTAGNAGWNQGAAFESGNPGGQAAIQNLVVQLQDRVSTLDAMIASGSFGCPGGAGCAGAQAVLARAETVLNGIIALSGAPSFTPPIPPAAPTAGSPAGQAIIAAIADLSSQLAGLGLSPLSPATMPLPGRRFSPDDIGSTLSNTAFGHESDVPEYTKRPNFGDIEVGVRLGLVQSETTRLAITAQARLPTGARDFADNLVDVGTGDRQLDAVVGIEAAVEPGPVSLIAAASYTWQFPGTILRRVTTPEHPIALSGTTALVNRDLGEMLWVTAYPGVRLAGGFNLHGLVSWFSKSADHFTATSATPGTLDPAILDQQTSMRLLGVGAGIAYRSTGRTGSLPIDAGVTWQTAISGSGGFAPKATVVTMYLRAYYRIWGS